jgi:hypothetical protein
MAKQPTKKRKRRKPNKGQLKSDDFQSVARRIECDEDKGRFEAKLAKIATAKVSAKTRS